MSYARIVEHPQMKRLDQLLERGFEVNVHERVPMREFYSPKGFFVQGRRVHPLYVRIQKA